MPRKSSKGPGSAKGTPKRGKKLDAILLIQCNVLNNFAIKNHSLVRINIVHCIVT